MRNCYFKSVCFEVLSRKTNLPQYIIMTITKEEKIHLLLTKIIKIKVFKNLSKMCYSQWLEPYELHVVNHPIPQTWKFHMVQTQRYLLLSLTISFMLCASLSYFLPFIPLNNSYLVSTYTKRYCDNIEMCQVKSFT